MKPASKDVAAIKVKLEELDRKAQEIGAEIYQKAAKAQQQPHAQEDPKKKGDKVVDADYEEKK